MSVESIIVEANYNTQSVWVDCYDIRLSEEETDLLSSALWRYKYQINFELQNRSVNKYKQWEFIIPSNFLEPTAKRLVEIIKELFPNRVVEYFEEK